jgi:predicted HD phosphohydrolase
MQAATIDMLFERLASRGQGAYGLADVSQLDHALQSAALASEQALGGAMIIAALFHDVGHLMSNVDTDLGSQGIDDRHEEASADVLEPLFGLEVSQPVRLHVAAKRYLCGSEPEYFDKLAMDSVRSLELQGGPMSTSELAEFEAQPLAQEAVALRRIDDAAKVFGLAVPGLESYRELAEKIHFQCKARLARPSAAPGSKGNDEHV